MWKPFAQRAKRCGKALQSTDCVRPFRRTSHYPGEHSGYMFPLRALVIVHHLSSPLRPLVLSRIALAISEESTTRKKKRHRDLLPFQNINCGSSSCPRPAKYPAVFRLCHTLLNSLFIEKSSSIRFYVTLRGKMPSCFGIQSPQCSGSITLGDLQPLSGDSSKNILVASTMPKRTSTFLVSSS